jgi:2'-5' RNA ligase
LADKNEHLVVIMLEPLPAGDDFEIWPPHITIVPWFPCHNTERLDEVLIKIAGRHQPFTAKAGKTEDWGRRDKFMVIKIEDDAQLHRLHWEVFRQLEKDGFIIHQKDFLGEKYTPHITLRNRLTKETNLKTGDTIAIGWFTLIKQLRLKGSGRMIKSVVKDYELGKR